MFGLEKLFGGKVINVYLDHKGEEIMATLVDVTAALQGVQDTLVTIDAGVIALTAKIAELLAAPVPEISQAAADALLEKIAEIKGAEDKIVAEETPAA